MDIDFRFDALSAIMAVLVLGVGTLILVYCARYFTDDDLDSVSSPPRWSPSRVPCSGLVTSDNMLLLYVFWELTTVLSFLLVGHYAERATSRRAATQALLVTTAGGLAMLVGMIILGQVGGSYNLSELVANADGVAPVRRDRPDPDRCALQIGNRAPALLASPVQWPRQPLSAVIFTLLQWSRPVSTSSRAWLPGTPIRRRGASPSSVWVCCR